MDKINKFQFILGKVEFYSGFGLMALGVVTSIFDKSFLGLILVPMGLVPISIGLSNIKEAKEEK